ncbi:MAG TPA: hypothetical protein VLT33_20440, partial [Labilithrix sp.]|nr:hypothetical protein [Labilithrix sp.]
MRCVVFVFVAAGIAAIELAACDGSSPGLVAGASDAEAGAVERDAATDADGGANDCPPPRQLSGSDCGCAAGDLFCAPLNECFSMRSLLPAGAGGCGPCSIACPPQQLCVQKDFEPPYGTCHETCGGSRESI